MNPISLISNHNPKNQLSFSPYHQLQTNLLADESRIKLQEISKQEFEENKNLDATFYQKEIKMLAYMNTIITAQLSSAIQQKKIIMKLINEAERREENVLEADKQKRIRRCAKDIQRKFKCQEHNCQKSYGTQGSLIQHIRLKHPQLNSHDPPLLLDPA